MMNTVYVLLVCLFLTINAVAEEQNPCNILLQVSDRIPHMLSKYKETVSASNGTYVRSTDQLNFFGAPVVESFSMPTTFQVAEDLGDKGGIIIGYGTFSIVETAAPGGEFVLGDGEEKPDENGQLGFHLVSNQAAVYEQSSRDDKNFDLRLTKGLESDPYLTTIDGAPVQISVETFLDAEEKRQYRSVILHSKPMSVEAPKKIVETPANVKDVRIVKADDGNYIVAYQLIANTPEVKGRGRVNALSFKKLEDINAKHFTSGRMFNGQVGDNEWIGVRQIINTSKKGLRGYLAYVGRIDPATGKENIYPAVFTSEDLQPKVILTMDELDLSEIRGRVTPVKAGMLMPQGIERHSDGTATIYLSVGQSVPIKVRINDPFAEYDGGIPETSWLDNLKK